MEHKFPSNYFDQGSTYIGSDGRYHAIMFMNPNHARNAMRRYRRCFPEHVKHINRCSLGRSLRARYLYPFYLFREDKSDF